ncbi:hypothetical protein [Archangium primigenium]|uniref:hypothetical protein n=1 Tax=[Archangium] primigenium TaxID=2792470 RepID=UPI001EF94936|nr:hypothetical protein [Archangium primigenium]
MKHILLSLALVGAVACGPAMPGADAPEESQTSLDSRASGLVTPAQGPIPAGLPARLLVGLFEDNGQTWMKNSGVPWDVRYRYLTKGWVNNWGWSPADGSFALQYMNESAAQGALPAVQFYQVNAEPGGGEDQFLSKVQNATTMRGYFSDFKLLMQRAKDHGKPVLVLLEADGYGLLQKQTGSNPHAPAAVASTGLPELAGLPNTVAGWGLAFLQLRKAVGASNAVLGIHVSAWASDKDVAYFSVTDPLQPEVDRVHAFLKPLGLGANVTGATYDVLVGDPLDRDSDFYARVQGQNRWWNASDSASVSSASFNRYAEWLRLWNVTAGKRWVLWQIPEGNSNHLNVDNAGGARQGYKDNRAEYFFGTGSAAHREKFASAGVIALLFGRGEGRQASHTNDVYSDGQPFLKSRAGAFLQAGGLPLPGGSTPPPTTPPPTTPPPATGDTAPYHFEDGTQGWVASGASVASSPAKAYAGSRSLAVAVAASGAGLTRVSVPNPTVAAGKTVSFQVWVPAGSRLTGVQPYVQEGAAGNWRWTGAWAGVGSLQAGGWSPVRVTVPPGAAALSQLGLELFTSGAWSGTVYVDAVAW